MNSTKNFVKGQHIWVIHHDGTTEEIVFDRHEDNFEFGPIVRFRELTDPEDEDAWDFQYLSSVYDSEAEGLRDFLIERQEEIERIQGYMVNAKVRLEKIYE
jgi:hypothetical protein